MKTYLKYLYPEIEPYETGYLPEEDGHQVYYEVSGNPNGIPIVYVHGGPGGGTSPVCRRFFDPKHYKIVLFDQRGCGKSKPSLKLENNNSQKLVSDMERLRLHLKVKQWVLFGGSWGTTLSLLYAIKFPQNVSSLILRGVFLARKSDNHWLYQEGASWFKPVEYARYTECLSKQEKQDIIKAYYHRMNSDDLVIKNQALTEWARWETCLVSVNKITFDEKQFKENAEIALLENWFFVNDTFIPENYILNNTDKIKDIPTYIVHGEYDLDCRPSGAYELHKKLPNSQLFLLSKTAHTQREYKIAQKLVEITDMLIDNKQ
ncbi:prolyl aminopeptidase [Mycoplasmopsis iners]|uniref:prolyl aminopeptidase n=1 Tax=Mycoplasmopsis iners TaxID=76630 RepID=UPI0004952BC2|nr:prolyl aminopeptidase [Mycoplasmopsis iners]